MKTQKRQSALTTFLIILFSLSMVDSYAASPSPAPVTDVSKLPSTTATPSQSSTTSPIPPSSSTQTGSQMAPSIAIIDTGVNDSLFSNIVGEYCVLKFGMCPNGKQIMDGKGAANIPATAMNPTLAHGTEMASMITKVNPAAKIIPIRIVGMSGTNTPMIATLDEIKWALDWVIINQSKYNIKVVSISQGVIQPNCGAPSGMASDIATLTSNGVAVIAAAGNNSNRSAMMTPACLPGVISIGATDNPDPGVTGKPYDPNAKPTIAFYSNGTSQTSFYLNARWYVLEPNGVTKFMVGTSNATAAMAGWWGLNYQGSWQATYDYMVKNAKTASNQWLSGRYVELPYALDK